MIGFLKPHLAFLTLVAAEAARVGRKVYQTGKNMEQRVEEALHPHKEDVITMKKTTFAAILVLFAALAGALAAAYFYLRRREAELDEYEQLLFSEDFSHEEADESAEPEAPAAEPEDAGDAPETADPAGEAAE